jgi:hypothetical protein
MKKHGLGSWIVGVIGVAAGAVPAVASEVTGTYDFTLGNFIDAVGNAPSPLASISGSFTITFNPSAYADNRTMGLVVNSLTDTRIASPIRRTNGPMGDFGFRYPDDHLATGAGDFSVNFKSLNPGFVEFALCSDDYGCGEASANTIVSGYTLAGCPDSVWLPGTGSVRRVPGPGSLPPLGTGLAVFAALRFRPRKTSETVH